MKFDTPIFQLKRGAKSISRKEGIPLNQALDQVAHKQGFKNWSHLTFYEQQERTATTLMKDLEPGDLLLLGARPRQGKTMLALHLLSRAVQSDMPGCFFTLEYTDDEVWSRLSGFGVKQSNYSESLNIDTSDEICAEHICKQLEEIGKPALVVIDYLQLLDQKRDKSDLQTQVSQLSCVARKTGSIIVTLSQIDRGFDPADERLPNVGDVRLPNPLDMSAFTKTCFLHEGRLQMNSHP